MNEKIRFQSMKKAFHFIFQRWWVIVIFWLVTVIIVFTNLFKPESIPSVIQSIFQFTCVILLVTSTIYNFKNKRTDAAVIALVLTIITLLIAFVIAISTMFERVLDGDHFADDLKIPENIEIYDPIDSYYGSRSDSLWLINKQLNDFEIRQSIQPGIYEYSIWYGNLEKGSVYIKAFEVTEGTKLSRKSVKERSMMEVYNPSNQIKRFQCEGDFTIYEGDFEKFYAARFEVWFIPDKGETERKLLEKNFKISGWQH